MTVATDETAALRAENEALRRRLAEAEETLAAIGAGDVDAFVVGGSGEERVYTLETADAPYRMMVERMAQGAATLSADGVLLYANGRLAELLGVSPERLPGTRLYAFAPAAEAERLRALLARAATEPCAVEATLCQSEGVTVPVYLGASPLRLGAGADGISLIVTDLTAQKHHEALARAQDALRESERRLATLVANLPGVVYRCRNDPQWSLEFASAPLAAMVGRSVEDFLTGRAHFADLIHPEDAARRREAVHAALEQRTPWELQYRIVVAGETRWVWDRGAAQFTAGESPVALEGFLVDVTERKALEEELRRTVTLLTEADRRKDAFLATLAHELRNPLAPIRNAVAVLARNGAPEPDLAWSREVIERQVTQLSRLLEDLLDVARISRDRLELRRERVTLADVVASAVETSGPLLASAHQTLVVTLPEAPVRLDADPVRLAQVFANLLNNASKYTDCGGDVRLEARCEGGEVTIRVVDDGIGIDGEMLPRLFDMFSQAQPARERSQGGLGIGLALVRGLVELHGGQVEAQSDGPGCGSTFIVRLPVLAAETSAPSVVDDVPEAPLDGGLRVLVADDNRDGAESLALLLRLLGHEVAVALDGEEALAQAERFAPQVLLLDLGMPKLGGLEVARAVRAAPWGRDAILLALTGWGREDDRRLTRAAGFDHHLVKPVDLDVLSQVIARFVGTRSRRETPATRES